MTKTVALVLMLSLVALEPTAMAQGPEWGHRHSGCRHAALGAVLGSMAGLFLAGPLVYAINPQDEATALLLGAGVIVGATLLGYTMAGGFSEEDAGLAIDQARERLILARSSSRQAPTETAVESPGPLPLTLTLSPIPELDLELGDAVLELSESEARAQLALAQR